MHLAAFAAELELDRAAVDLDMMMANGGQAEALVVARVLGIADPDERGLEQTHHGRQHPLARQAWAAQVGIHARPDLRQCPREHQDPVELVGIADLPPLLVVAVLLAPARIASGRLEMAARMRADPHGGPCRRDRQPAQPRQLLALGDHAPLRIA